MFIAPVLMGQIDLCFQSTLGLFLIVEFGDVKKQSKIVCVEKTLQYSLTLNEVSLFQGGGGCFLGSPAKFWFTLCRCFIEDLGLTLIADLGLTGLRLLFRSLQGKKFANH